MIFEDHLCSVLRAERTAASWISTRSSPVVFNHFFNGFQMPNRAGKPVQNSFGLRVLMMMRMGLLMDVRIGCSVRRRVRMLEISHAFTSVNFTQFQHFCQVYLQVPNKIQHLPERLVNSGC